jgi:hypothetical protein
MRARIRSVDSFGQEVSNAVHVDAISCFLRESEEEFNAIFAFLWHFDLSSQLGSAMETSQAI